MQKINIKKILEETVDFYNREKNKILFNFTRNSNYFIYGNKERLSQIFNNLIDNALSFNKKNNPTK